MSIPPKYNYRFYEGDDSSIIIRYTDGDGVPIDLSADTFQCQVRDVDDNLILDLTGAVNPLQTNEVEFPINGASTIGLAGSSGATGYCYDVQRTFAITADIETLVRGQLTVYKEITE